MKRSIKFFCIVFSLIFVIGLVFTGCGGADESAGINDKQQESKDESAKSDKQDSVQKDGAKEKLVVWLLQSFSPEADKMLRDRVLEFGEKNGVEIETENLGLMDAYNKWNVAIESNQLPDVSFSMVTVYYRFADLGLWMDVDPLIEEIEQQSGPFDEKQKEFLKVDGKLYAIPLYTSSPILFYRKDLLEKAGYDHPPETWDEFKEMAKAVHDPKNGVYGVGLGTGKNDDGESEQRGIIWSYGGALFDEEGNPKVADNPGTLEGFKFLADMYREGLMPRDAVVWDAGSNNSSFLSGQSAFVINAATLYNQLKGEGFEEMFEKTGVSLIPEGPEGRFIMAGGAQMGIFKSTENPELCKELLKYIYDKDWYESWAENNAPVAGPVLEEVKNTPLWQDDPVNKLQIEAQEDAVRAGYPATSLQSVQDGMKIFNEFLLNQAFQKIILEDYTDEQALEWLQDKMEASLEK